MQSPHKKKCMTSLHSIWSKTFIMSHYVVIRSDQNLNYFPENQPFHFRTHFQTPLNLKGIWKVALVDIHIADSAKVRFNLFMHCNICDGCILDGERENLLRMVKSIKLGNWSQTFDTPQYASVNKTDIRDLEVFIRDGKGNLASFLKKPVTLVLHFKAYPLYV